MKGKMDSSGYGYYCPETGAYVKSEDGTTNEPGGGRDRPRFRGGKRKCAPVDEDESKGKGKDKGISMTAFL